MENTTNTNETTSVLSALEALQLKLENLEGISHVCATAFSAPGTLGNVNEQDLERSFCSIRDQAEEIDKEIQELIIKIVDHKARLDY